MNKLLVDEQFEIEMTWAARSKYHATASLGWLSDHEISECGVANIMAHNFYNKRSWSQEKIVVSTFLSS